MKIAISGGASQGKSTLVNRLQNDEMFKGYKFQTNLTRNLRQQGIPINEDGTAVTQLHVMLKHFERLQGKDNVILDRCALDGLAYSMYFFNDIEESVRDIIVMMFETMIDKYDKLFYIIPELSLVEDGERSVNKDFFDIVNSNFDHIINEYKIDVIRLHGSIEQRITQIKQAL
jgi:nicotinamide riboside kinase